MRVPRPLVVALPVAAALTFTACGAEAGSNPTSASFSDAEQQAVAATVEDISSATSSRDYAKLCSDYLAAPLVKQLETARGADGCPARLEQSLRDVDQSDLAVLKVTVQGANAEALVQPTGSGNVEKQARLALAKEGSRWKLSGIR